MPKYKCPVTTCNVNFEGSILDILTPAIMHGEGSHQMNLSENDIAQIIEKQARLESTEEFLPSSQEEEPSPIIESGIRAKYDWWKK